LLQFSAAVDFSTKNKIKKKQKNKNVPCSLSVQLPQKIDLLVRLESLLNDRVKQQLRPPEIEFGDYPVQQTSGHGFKTT